MDIFYILDKGTVKVYVMDTFCKKGERERERGENEVGVKKDGRTRNIKDCRDWFSVFLSR